MCAIGGFWADESKETLQKMTDILQHRGQQQWHQGLQLSDLFFTQFRVVGGKRSWTEIYRLLKRSKCCK